MREWSRKTIHHHPIPPFPTKHQRVVHPLNTGVGKCSISEIRNITFKIFQVPVGDELSPILGWCSIGAFTNPCFKMGGTPSFHPFIDGIFHYKPSSYGGSHGGWCSPRERCRSSNGPAALLCAGQIPANAGLLKEWEYDVWQKDEWNDKRWWMDGWMDGLMDGWRDGWIER